MPTTYLRQMHGETLRWLERFPARRNAKHRRAYLLTKRGLDLLLVTAMMPLVLPILTVTAIALKLESPHAPILFVRERTGRNGAPFPMYKFRSMRPDAEQCLKELQHLNQRQGGDIKIPNDPRVTRVGRVIRATKIDELPQFINVLKGEMSLVGPRPTSYGLDAFQVWHSERFDAAPGITGVWQLVQNRVTHLDDKIRLDIAYLERQSLMLDMALLVQTAVALSRGHRSE